jgi:hypothetical protein
VPFFSNAGSGSTAEAGGGSFIATCFVSAQLPSAAIAASATIGPTLTSTILLIPQPP